MQIVRAVLLAVAVSTAAPAAGQQQTVKADASFLVERGRAGVFQTGMTVDAVRA